ncbi:MAG: hypothetical protein MJY83_07990, partial [Bacteroidales bacterium]|nr:hypothetical protein [Bacteroidales bacterium]
MKKIFALLFAAASMMTAVSCNRVFDEKDVPSDGTIYVTRIYEAGFEASSKTFADASGKVNWEQGDVIRYYSVNNGTVGEVVLPEGGATAQLPLEVAVDASYLVCVHGGFSISNPSADGLTIVGALNNVQSGVFGENHVALVKTSGVNSPTLTFHNIVSYYKFTFIIDDVKSVVFKSNDGIQLHGNGNINVVFDGDEATASLGSGGESKITVNNGGRGTFYIAALPGTLQDGFTIDCYDSSHSLIGSVKTTKPVELKPNSILNLGVLDTRISQDYMDLSAPGTANSYIVSETGFYKFKTVKGNSSESVGSVASAEVLWETFGTDVAPVEGELVDGVYLDGDYINFRASDLKGNAVIAAKDASGTILWSWHIWLTDQPVDQVYNNGAGTLMDRNLGATSATPGDVHALGLLYQWGRKDPFLGGNAISSTTMASSTGTWPAAISIADITGDNSLSYALSNPMTFIFNNESVPFDWYSTDATLSNNELWSEDKSTYDPCPPGYSVPEGGADGVWARAAGTSTTTTVPLFETKISEENGIDFSSSSVGSYALGASSVIWYPSTGSRLYSTGDLFSVGLGGSYWSCSHVGSQSNIFNFRENGYYAPADVSYRVIGRSVRCYKEGSSTFVPVTAISLNKTS